MMQKRMQDTRLDLEAPLLSVRRHSAQPAGNPPTKPEEPVATKPLTPSWRPALPFYNSELKSGPVRNPGVVPFVWEQEPGQPKASPTSRQRPVPVGPVPLFPPGRTPIDRAAVVSEESMKEEEEEDNFSNAVETLSCTESFFMNCSVSGIVDAVEVSGTMSTDPQARASMSMMERFLPAAQAMASSSTQCAPRKPPKMGNRFENEKHQLRRSPLPYQHMPNFVARYPHDEIDGVDGEDDEYDKNSEGDGHFTSKACGLLPGICLKSSFCLLNPMSGVKVGCGRPLPPATSGKIRSTMHSNIPLSQAEDELWRLMYKHKQRVGIPHEEEGSRNTSKSNEHSQSSDSQTLDEFSPRLSNRETLVQILKRDMKNGNNDGSESFDKDGVGFWAMISSNVSQQESSVLSPTRVKDAHMDVGVLFEIPHSLAGSTNREIVLNQRMEESPVIEVDNEHVNRNGGSQFVKRNGQSKNNSGSSHSLLPLPLPNTPSESWLSRTLPSVSSKIPSGQSIFGVHVPRRKVAFNSSSTDLRQESDANPLESPEIFDVKHSKTPRRQIRFADVLMTPLSPRSEM